MKHACYRCNIVYDDARRSILCPHEALMSPAQIERDAAAFALLDKSVRFAHQPDGPFHRVRSISPDGMVTIDTLPGEFAPHLFVPEERAC